MPAITDVTIAVGATSIIAAADWKTLGAPVTLKNEGAQIMTLTISGADTMALDPGETQPVIPGQIITGTVPSGTELLQLYQGILPDSEVTAKAVATAAAAIIAAMATPGNLVGTIVVVTATGSGAIATFTASTKRFRLIAVTCLLDTGPTTSEDFGVILMALGGGDYSAALFSVDPSLVTATDIVFIPDGELIFEAGDQIAVGYTNTDGATYGLRIVIEEF